MDARPPTTAPRRTLAQRVGEAGESSALAFLEAQGLRALARNVRFKGGELDLVMLDATVLVFVEVRCRRRGGFGDALESIDARKRRRLVRAAQGFLQREPRHAVRACRFDVVAFDAGGPARWVRDAFRLDTA